MDLRADLLAHLELLQQAEGTDKAALNQKTAEAVVGPAAGVAALVQEVLDRAVLVIILLHLHRKETTAGREVRVQLPVIELVVVVVALAQLAELVQILLGVMGAAEDLFLKLE
jgi:hypothetical protein